jgi:hypothetical protein
VKQAKAVPMKAKFVPGVTKNPKFEHVGSRVAGLIRVRKEAQVEESYLYFGLNIFSIVVEL